MISGVSGSSNYWEQIAAMKSQQEQLKNPFEETDASGDGFLDIEELTTFAGKISEMTGQEVDAEELLAKLDTDEDGLVSEEEFEAGRPKGPPPPPPEMMTNASNGVLQTLMATLSGSEDEEDEESTGTTDALDTNGDGIVDAEELEAGINKLVQAYQQQAGGGFFQESALESGLDLQV